MWVAVLPHPAEAGIRAQNAFAAIVLSGNGGHCAAASVIFSVANSITFVQISSLLTLLATWRLRAQRAPPLGRKPMSLLWLSLSSIPFARGRPAREERTHRCCKLQLERLLQTTARRQLTSAREASHGTEFEKAHLSTAGTRARRIAASIKVKADFFFGDIASATSPICHISA